MQFDKDLNSIYAKLFLDIRALLLKQIGDDVYEKFSENITSFFSSLGGFCYVKTTPKGIHIGWFRGVHIRDSYGLLFGKGKTIRGQSVHNLDKVTKKAIKHYIQETQNFLMEHQEITCLKKHLKNTHVRSPI